MATFTGTEEQMTRLAAKVALDQAELAGTSLEDITLTYARFDSDTGEAIDDEVLDVDVTAIQALHDGLDAQATAIAARVTDLAGLLSDLAALVA